MGFLESDFSNLPTRLAGKFQAVLVLGNSLPHVLDGQDLAASLRGLAGVMEPQAILVLQLLNYERILADRERIVGVNRDQDTYFVRFYDFLEDLVQFNVLVISDEGRKDQAPADEHATEALPAGRDRPGLGSGRFAGD